MIPLIGYAPDADVTQPGVMSDVTNIIPTERAFVGAPTGVTPSGVGALAAECRGAVVVTLLDGTRRVFAGAQTRLYELVSTTWTDRSAAGNYTGSADNRWSFCSFGSTTIASNYTEAINASASGAFTALTAPKAKIVVSSNNFVLAFATNEGTYGNSPDRWWCSALLDHTDWVVSVSTQANTGRLVSVPGAITAALPLGAQVVVYKEQGLYLGSYVGSPAVWQFDQVPAESGCIGQDAVCDVDGAHVYVGMDNIFVFDGTRPVPIATSVIRQWFFNNSNPVYRYKTICKFDRQNNRVWIFYPSATSTTLDAALVYHLTSKRWGKVTASTQAALNYAAPGYTIDGLATVSATIDGLAAFSLDSQVWLSGSRAFALFNGSNQIKVMNGSCDASSFTTGDIGDDDSYTTLRRVRIRFLQAPLTATGMAMSKPNAGETLSLRSSFTMVGSRADILQSDRWHRITFSFTGDVEFTALGVDLVPDGEE